jgi:hypothetical protein
VRPFFPKVPFSQIEAPRTDREPLAPVDQLGPVLQQQVPVVTGNDMQSMLAAFNKRCNFVSHESVDPEIVKSAKNLADLVFPEGITSYGWSEDIFERWIAKFRFEKQLRMRAALLNLHDVDFRSINTKSLMVKGEVLLKRNDPSWAPRVIYVGSDEYNVLTGPLMDEFNKRLKHALDEFRCPEFVVKFAYTERDTSIAHFMDGCDRYYEGDFSANDRAQLREVVLIFAHWLKRSGAPKWFVRFYVKNSLKFMVKSYEYGISAELQFQLATGGTDTTARNTCWNLSLWYSFCRSLGIKRTKVAVLGDDIAAGTDHRGIPLKLWVSHCMKAGMTLKAFEKRYLCDLTFLSRFFYGSGESAFMIPLIGKALCRFNARANRNEDISDQVYMAGKALSYAYEFRHVAYLRDKFLQRFRSTGVDLGELSLLDLTWFSRQSVHSVQAVHSSIINEPLVIDDLEFLEIVMGKYDLGLYDMDDLCDRLILDDRAYVFQDERYYLLAHEVE